MLELYYDFHIHSCLSPCGADDMTPQNIVGMAVLAGYNVIAITDHNSTRNCKAVAEVAKEAGILAIPAMELTTKEEVHVLCFFPDLDAAEDFDKYVYGKLPNIQNRANVFGRQLCMDAEGHVTREEDKLLISATDIGIYEVYNLMKSYGGTAIPAHIDRPSFSLISNLGLYDTAMRFPAIELTANCDSRAFKKIHNIWLPHIVNSDAHALEQIPDSRNKIWVSHFCVQEVIRAIEQNREEKEIL
jgi:hypothetical protein